MPDDGKVVDRPTTRMPREKRIVKKKVQNQRGEE